MIRIEMNDDVVAMLMMANGIEPDPEIISGIVEELVVMHCRERHAAGLGYSDKLENLLEEYETKRKGNNK